MKRIGSVYMAAFRNLWWKLLVVLAILAVSEYFLFRNALDRILLDMLQYEWLVPSFHMAVENGKLYLIFFAALAAVMALCVLQGCRFSGKNLYLLQRLSIPEWRICLHWALAHLACLVILWAVQLAVVLGLWQYYRSCCPVESPGLELLISLYSSGFLHLLLPLADGSRWLRLLVYLVTAAVMTASFGFFQRRGRLRIGLLIMLGIYFTMPQSMGNAGSDYLFSILCVVLLAWQIYCVWGEYHEAENHSME